MGVSWRAIKTKVDGLKRKWRSAKGEGETGIGLPEPGSVLAHRQAKCHRFAELDQLFSSRQPQSAGTSYGDLPSTSARDRSPVQQEDPAEVEMDPNTETVGDYDVPDMTSRRRVRRAPRTVMSGFVNVERTLQEVSIVELDMVREKNKMAREELDARKKMHQDEIAIQARYHNIMEGELELRKRELESKIAQNGFDNDMRKRRMELAEAKERRRQMREDRLARL